MYNRILLTLLMAFFLAAGTVAAHASVTEIQYTFFAQLGGNDTASAQFVVPTFITSDVTIPASQIEFCQVVASLCTSVTLKPNQFIQDVGVGDLFGENTQSAALNYLFPQGSFDKLGTYFDLSGTALLSVQQVTVNSTPEPSSVLLMGSGILGMVGLVRRKLAASL